MRFRFSTTETEDDALFFHVFNSIDSPAGKKQLIPIYCVFLFYFLFHAVKTLFSDGLGLNTLLFCIILGLFLLLLAFLSGRLIQFLLKCRFKRMIKSGDLPFSANSTIEFYEDKLIEFTEFEQLEVRYEALKKIQVVDTRYIYIYDQNKYVFILPIPQVMQQANAADFLEFLFEKCGTVEYC